MVFLDVHYMLYYLIQRTPKTQSTIYRHKHYKGTVSELIGSMEEAGLGKEATPM